MKTGDEISLAAKRRYELRRAEKYGKKYDADAICFLCGNIIPANTLCYVSNGKIYCQNDSYYSWRKVSKKGTPKILPIPDNQIPYTNDFERRQEYATPYLSHMEGRLVKDKSNRKSIRNSIANYEGSEDFWDNE